MTTYVYDYLSIVFDNFKSILKSDIFFILIAIGVIISFVVTIYKYKY